MLEHVGTKWSQLNSEEGTPVVVAHCPACHARSIPGLPGQVLPWQAGRQDDTKWAALAATSKMASARGKMSSDQF